jgi:hypothetical protein
LKFSFKKWNVPKYLGLSFKIIFYLEEIIFENFKNSENNIINVELAKVLGYSPLFRVTLARVNYHPTSAP